MNFLEIFTSQIGQGKVDEMSNAIGADKNQTMAALGAAVPLLVSAMARNTRNEDGAQSLAGALDRDHDGGILQNLGGLFSNPSSAKGDGILNHVLGGRREVAQSAISQSSGLSAEATSKMLQIVAPMVLGMIGKKKKDEGFGAGILATMLSQFSQTHETNVAPQPESSGSMMGNIGSMVSGAATSGLGSMITGILDRDNDGSVMDDIGGMIGGMMSGKK